MEQTTLQHKKVLVAALDWGMGHLTRLTELLKHLDIQKLTIACTPFQRDYFSLHFPEAQYELIGELNWRWTGNKGAISELLLQRKKWNQHLKKDLQIVNDLVNKHGIEVILSDNRYGFYHPDTFNICLTHQLDIPGNRLEKPIIKRLLHKYLSPFHEIWVPDYESRSLRLSGELSESNDISFAPVKYIGPLSRFKWTNSTQQKDGKTLILSGPEPQRRLFLERVLEQQKDHLSQWTVVTPIPYPIEALDRVKQLLIQPSLEHLNETLEHSHTIISRAGYTTIMETHLLENCRKIIVPTPGQREQQCLAKHLNGRHGFESCAEKELEKCLVDLT